MVNFIPEPIKGESFAVPFFEDVKASDVAGRATGKTVASLQKEISALLIKLGAGFISFQPGEYPGTPKRFGFQIHFQVGANPARIDCAALPIRKLTPNKKDRALAQALFLVRDELKASHMAKMYKPGSAPLLPYLLSSTGKTVTEVMIEQQYIPMLPAPGQNGR